MGSGGGAEAGDSLSRIETLTGRLPAPCASFARHALQWLRYELRSLRRRTRARSSVASVIVFVTGTRGPDSPDGMEQLGFLRHSGS